MKVSLRGLRANANLSQDDVCREMHIAKSTLINWEKNKTFPTAPQLNRLCVIYHCTMDDIFIPETLTLK